jgi:hypothetical protein
MPGISGCRIAWRELCQYHRAERGQGEIVLPLAPRGKLKRTTYTEVMISPPNTFVSLSLVLPPRWAKT